MEAELSSMHLYQDAAGENLKTAIAFPFRSTPGRHYLTNGADEQSILVTLAFLDPAMK